jgi:predicted permease
MAQPTPPRLAERTLRAFLPGGIRTDMIVGDLREEFAERSAASDGHALRWYVRAGAGLALRYLILNTARSTRLDPEGPGTLAPLPPNRWALAMESFIHDLRYAARTLIKRPMLTGIVVATLALAIGANTTVFSLIDYMLFRPLPIDRPDRVVRIYTSDYSSGPIGQTSYPDFESLTDGITGLAHSAAYDGNYAVNVARSEGAFRLQTGLVSGDFFTLLGARPALGRLISAGDETAVDANPVVVLSHATWRTYFGSAPDIAGRTLTLNGEPLVVIGVTEASYTGIDIGSTPDMWIPMTMYGVARPGRDDQTRLERRDSRWVSHIGRLEDGVSPEQVQSQATVVMAQLAEQFPETNRGMRDDPEAARPMTVLPLADQGGTRSQIADRATFLTIIMGLVLLIACANVANILVAQGQRRRQEFAVRLALGANRGQLSRQVLFESTLLALLGGTAGLTVAFGLSRLFVPLGLPSVLAGSLTLETVPLDGRAIIFTLGVSLLTGIVFGSLPALGASRPDLVPALKAHAEPVGSRGRRWGLRDALVVFQVAISMVLLMGAGLFVRALVTAYDTELGFEPAGVAITTLDVGRERMSPEQGVAYYTEVLERVQSLPGVESASLARYVPVQSLGGRRGYRVEGLDPASVEAAGIRINPRGYTELNMNTVSPGYFATLGIDLLQGRAFLPTDDATAQPVVMVNREFAETFWPGQPAVGQRISSSREDQPPLTVIGVVRSGKYRNVQESTLPYLYLPQGQAYLSNVVLAVRGDGSAEAIIPHMTAAVRAIRPEMPLVNTRTLEDHLGNSLSRQRTTMTLVAALGGLALLVAAVGLYGLLAYAVATRRREIGIRNALGAQASSLLGMILGQGMRLVVVGIVLGSLAAVVLGQLLSAIVVGVGVTDPAAFGATAGLLLLVALAASYLPARRAMKVDPVSALRAE